MLLGRYTSDVQSNDKLLVGLGNPYWKRRFEGRSPSQSTQAQTAAISSVICRHLANTHERFCLLPNHSGLRYYYYHYYRACSVFRSSRAGRCTFRCCSVHGSWRYIERHSRADHRRCRTSRHHRHSADWHSDRDCRSLPCTALYSQPQPFNHVVPHQTTTSP